MSVDLTPEFREYFGRNRGPEPANPDQRVAPDYGVDAQLDGSVIQLRLTFRRDRVYCCFEAGCHIALPDGERWHWLRTALSERRISLPTPMTLHMEVVVEEGAIFFDMLKPDPGWRNWYEFTPSPFRHYVHTAAECPDTDNPPVVTDHRCSD